MYAPSVAEYQLGNTNGSSNTAIQRRSLIGLPLGYEIENYINYINGQILLRRGASRARFASHFWLNLLFFSNVSASMDSSACSTRRRTINTRTAPCRFYLSLLFNIDDNLSDSNRCLLGRFLFALIVQAVSSIGYSRRTVALS